jgi:hypothetical protein
VERSSSDGIDSVLADDVQSRKHTVSLLLTEDLEQDLSRVVDSSSLGAFLFLDLGLAADTGDSEEQLSDEGNGGLLMARFDEAVERER